MVYPADKSLTAEEFPGFLAIYNKLKSDYDIALAKYNAAKLVSDQMNKEYSDYKAAFKHYLNEKLEYESEQDYGSGKLLMHDPITNQKLVYNLGDADRLYNWDAGLRVVPRSTIDGAVWDDSYLGEDERSYNGIRDSYYEDADGNEVEAPAEGAEVPEGVAQVLEPGIAGQEVRLTRWYCVPVPTPTASRTGTPSTAATSFPPKPSRP